jgi:glycosyltransferase involved in cell wall biosynthesis
MFLLQRPIRACHIAREPITIWAFLRDLIKEQEKHGFEVEAVCNDNNPYLLTKLKNDGININIIKAYRTLNPLSIYRAYKEFKNLFILKHYDMVITHTPLVSFIARFAAYRAKVPKIIYTVHALPFYKGMNPIAYVILMLAEKITGIITHGMICVNYEDYITAKKLKLIKPSNIVEIHGIGVDIDKFKRTQEEKKIKNTFLESLIEKELIEFDIKINESTKVIGLIARLVKSKGIREYLLAANEIIKKRKDILFLLVGYGELEIEVTSFIKKNKLEKNLLFLGFREDIHMLMKTFDIFLLPTYHEGLPRTILEAMASSVPVITTDVRGARQLIIDGENGILVLPKNHYKIVDAVYRIIDNDEAKNEMGKNSREASEQIYDIKNGIEKQIEFYKR